MPSTKLFAIKSYQSLFPCIEKGGLLIPSSYLNEDKNIDSLVNHIIENFDSKEGISYSSFLNAIVQTSEPQETQKNGWKELKLCKIVNNDNNSGIVFHRNNLLYMVAQLIRKDKIGNERITGPKNMDNAASYYKSLLFINGKSAFRPPKPQPEQILLRDYFLREYPYYYRPDMVEHVYEMRFQRYWYIYNNLLKQFDDRKTDKIKEGIELITRELSISLKDYFDVMVGMFTWFLRVPNVKRRNPTNDDSKKLNGFNPKNPESFYIRKQSFGEEHDLIKLVTKLSRNLYNFKQKLEKPR